MFAGIANAFRSPYLVNVSLFVLLFAISSTFLYFQQAEIVRTSFTDRGAQTAFFATRRPVGQHPDARHPTLPDRSDRRAGSASRSRWRCLPAATILGFGVLAVAPTVGVLAVFQVLRRAGDYAIARPTREILFTVVPREDRYKTKSFIDTVVYRFGDQVGAWTVAGFVGFGAGEAALVAIPVAAVWLVNALWLGRRQGVLEAAEEVVAGRAAPAGRA